MTKRRIAGAAFFLAAVMMMVGCNTQQGAGQVDIQGKLVTACGQPLAYKAVYIPGHQPVLTDSEGGFAVSDVKSPYDIIVANVFLTDFSEGPDLPVVVYQGLTRTDPTLTLRSSDQRRDPGCVASSVAGSFYPAGSDENVESGALLFIGNRARVGYEYRGDYKLSLDYSPDYLGANNASLIGLQWIKDSDTGNPKAFFYGGRETLTLGDGQRITDHVLKMSPIGSRILSVSVTKPDLLQLSDDYAVSQYVTVDGLGTLMSIGDLGGDEVDENGRYVFVGPSAPDLGIGSTLVANGDYSGEFLRPAGVESDYLTGIDGYGFAWTNAGEDGDVEIDLGNPLIPITPLNDVAVDPGEAVFSWRGNEGAVYIVDFDLDGRVGVEVVTTSTSFSFPDLSGLGIDFSGLHEGEWMITEMEGSAMPASVDDVAGEYSRMFRDIMSNSFITYPTYPGEWGRGYYVRAGEFRIESGASED